MKTILVPTDFSDNAKNAALYALHLAGQIQAQKIIFYNAYMPPPAIDEPAAIPVLPMYDLETFKNISSDNLVQFVDALRSFVPPGVEVEQKSEYSDVTSDIDMVCETTGADLIVVGITGSSAIEEVLIGSTAVSIIKHTKIPVVIVPLEAAFTSINNIILACDFKKVAETTPVSPIKNILDATDAELHVLNVYEEAKDISSDVAQEKELLTALFQEYEPQFHFVKNEDFISGINDFVAANSIDMIIAIPKKHGFLQGLFKERHSKKLAFHSHVPLMYIHEEDL